MAAATTALNYYNLFLVFFFLSITSLASAIGNGTASSYKPDPFASACNKNGSTSYAETLVAMVPKTAFNNGAACGKMFKISCMGAIDEYPKDPCKQGQWVTVTVANECGGDDCADFTLSLDAYSVIANPLAGRVNITYRRYHKGNRPFKIGRLHGTTD